MNSGIINSETGGFLELELAGGQPYHAGAVELNSARNALVYFLSQKKARTVFIPDYICGTLIRALEKAKLDYRFYRISNDFLPAEQPELSDDEFLLYVNYFGIMNHRLQQVRAMYPQNLIIDNAQAFYAAPANAAAAIYSPRKFFGVADGGYLISDLPANNGLKRDVSWERYGHLLQRHDCSARDAYDDFLQNETLIGKLPPRYMSQITRRLLNSIDYQSVKQKRLSNFQYYQSRLDALNAYPFELGQNDVPMVYPFLCPVEGLREYLIEHQIYVARYWAEAETRSAPESFANRLSRYLVPLPVDQRYDENQLQRVAEMVIKHLKSNSGGSE